MFVFLGVEIGRVPKLFAVNESGREGWGVKSREKGPGTRGPRDRR